MQDWSLNQLEKEVQWAAESIARAEEHREKIVWLLEELSGMLNFPEESPIFQNMLADGMDRMMAMEEMSVGAEHIEDSAELEMRAATRYGKQAFSQVDFAIRRLWAAQDGFEGRDDFNDLQKLRERAKALRGRIANFLLELRERSLWRDYDGHKKMMLWLIGEIAMKQCPDRLDMRPEGCHCSHRSRSECEACWRKAAKAILYLETDELAG